MADQVPESVSEAVIIAAGFGSRISERFSSKPLATIRGVPLIEIAIGQAASAGIEKVFVVTGHEAQRVEDALAAIGSRHSVQVVPVRLDTWDKPNGWSVIAGAERVRGDFLLMMADHVFGDGILDRLARQSFDGVDVILAADRPDNPLVDPEDATWLERRHDGKIANIGKGLKSYDAVDCGAFLANHKLPAAIRRAIVQGLPGSLSDGMRVLADEGRAQTMDICGQWWLDVDDLRAHDLAEQQTSQYIAWLNASAGTAQDIEAVDG